MAQAIKITIEKGYVKNRQKLVAFCDTDCFVEGKCALEQGRCEYGKEYCCIICSYVMDCDGACERIER